MGNESILLLEPFYGGSHKVLIDSLMKGLTDLYGVETVFFASMKAKKWHWRARTSALHFSDIIPYDHKFRVLFTSSVLNLAELIALRQDLAGLKKLVYFHENQLVYPIRQYKDRDFQYGYNQILTCLVADEVLFNSDFNRTSFLNSMKKFFSLQPDYRPKDLRSRIEHKCRVLYFPLSSLVEEPTQRDFSLPLHIVWPHRWEHDKNPGAFLEVLYSLVNAGCEFRVSLVGEQFTEVSSEFGEAKQVLSDRIVHWGFLPKEDYLRLLSTAHVAVSTSNHEFFGVAMLEAAMRGCFPLCPNKLVYPEIYPPNCLYKDQQELELKLKSFCKTEFMKETLSHFTMDFTRFTESILMPQFMALFS